MSAELVQELERTRPEARVRSRRARIVAGIGPVTVLVGVIWAIVQPYRLTVLHPHAQGVWWLISEPPLYVIVAGFIFWRVIARSLIEDLEAAP